MHNRDQRTTVTKTLMLGHRIAGVLFQIFLYHIRAGHTPVSWYGGSYLVIRHVLVHALEPANLALAGLRAPCKYLASILDLHRRA